MKMQHPGIGRVAGVGLLVGLLLNVTGWLGNNFVLGEMWQSLHIADAYRPWRASIWRDVLSLVPDFVYGVGIAWLCLVTRPRFRTWFSSSFASGSFVAIIGGLTTYLAIANSGFIPWRLALASFLLVIATKLPLALLAGYLLEERDAEG